MNKGFEAVACKFAPDLDPNLERTGNLVLGAAEVAQQPDGYLDTCFPFE